MTRTDSTRGRIALMVAHCAGMVDLVALPVWVGTLISRYQLDPQQAGGLVTLFLVGAVISSLFFASRFDRVRGRVAAPIAFAASAVAFLLLSRTSDYGAMAALHGVAGIASGCGLSFTHGTIGRSLNPHRLFAIAGMAIGVFAILFLGATPPLVAALGGPSLFLVFGGVMLVASLLCAAMFPETDALAGPEQPAHAGTVSTSTLPGTIWFGIAGVSLMALTQAMTFSFVERIGADRGFGIEKVTAVLIGVGFVNLFPAALAALLERRWLARWVMIAGPVCQAVLALTLTLSSGFVAYAGAASMFVAIMLFTHTFAFGLLARMDASGRAVAATPAMLMVGAAIGPILGGTLVKNFGYGAIGVAAAAIACLAVLFFSRIGTTSSSTRLSASMKPRLRQTSDSS